MVSQLFRNATKPIVFEDFQVLVEKWVPADREVEKGCLVFRYKFMSVTVKRFPDLGC